MPTHKSEDYKLSAVEYYYHLLFGSNENDLMLM